MPVIIQCSGKGYPVPLVRWFRDGLKINTNKSLDVYQVPDENTSPGFLEWIKTTLHVNPDSTYSQFGNYTCNATKPTDDEKDLQDIEIVRKYLY